MGEREKALFGLEEIGTTLKATLANLKTETHKSIFPHSPFAPSPKYKNDALFDQMKKDEAAATPSPH